MSFTFSYFCKERLQNINLDWAGSSYVAMKSYLDAGVLTMAIFEWSVFLGHKKARVKRA